jgi:acyl-coenzyme A thioesterase PaaI-like protein
VASTLVPVDRGPVTTTLTVNYLAAARDTRLDGTARGVRSGRSLAFVEMEVDDAERRCLTGSRVWFLMPSR